jgi:hypothetical protein
MANGRKYPNGITHPSGRQTKKIKQWMLSDEAGFDGDGNQVPCFWCQKPLDYTALTLDRWPIAGRSGGSYHRDNLVPACQPCNNHRDSTGNSPQIPLVLPKGFFRSLVLVGWAAYLKATQSYVLPLTQQQMQLSSD